MTRSQSIDASNEATSMAGKLAWIAFQQEIWFDHDDGGWVPGEPLYKDPRAMYYEDYQYDEDGTLISYAGVNTVRPMYQITDEHYDVMRCKECQVWWPGDDSCWICGKECPSRVPSFQLPAFDRYAAYIQSDAELTYRLYPSPRVEYEQMVAERERRMALQREESRRRQLRIQHEREAREEQRRERASISYAYTDGEVTFQITRETYDRLREEWIRVTGRPDDIPPSLRWANREANVPTPEVAPTQTDDDVREDGRPPIPVHEPWWRQFQRSPWERFRRSR